MSYYSRAVALYPEDKEIRRKYLIKNLQNDKEFLLSNFFKLQIGRASCRERV